jgi:hypothetical protein
MRQYRVKYRRPYGTEWEELDLETAMDMIADRLLKTRDETWEEEKDGAKLRRTLGFAHLGRRHAGQRGELPHQEVLHRDGGNTDREPGPHLTLKYGPRSGDLVR